MGRNVERSTALWKIVCTYEETRPSNMNNMQGNAIPISAQTSCKLPLTLASTVLILTSTNLQDDPQDLTRLFCEDERGAKLVRVMKAAGGLGAKDAQAKEDEEKARRQRG